MCYIGFSILVFGDSIIAPGLLNKSVSLDYLVVILSKLITVPILDIWIFHCLITISIVFNINDDLLVLVILNVQTLCMETLCIIIKRSSLSILEVNGDVD